MSSSPSPPLRRERLIAFIAKNVTTATTPTMVNMRGNDLHIEVVPPTVVIPSTLSSAPSTSFCAWSTSFSACSWASFTLSAFAASFFAVSRLASSLSTFTRAFCAVTCAAVNLFCAEIDAAFALERFSSACAFLDSRPRNSARSPSMLFSLEAI